MSSLLMTGRTDPGMVREHNEDCFLTVPESGIAILADGMGGHLAGEVASAMAIDRVTHSLLHAFAEMHRALPESGNSESFESAALVEAIKAANSAIHAASMNRPEQAGMGTTIVAASFHDNLLTVAHVGDSRLYRYRHGVLNQVTEDHSMVQELLRRGLMTAEEARTSVNRNLVTRALGVDPSVEVEVKEQPFENDDIYLLCSDGLNDVLLDEEIAAILAQHPEDLDAATQQMITDVNARGGPDNVSIVLVRTGGRFARATGSGQTPRRGRKKPTSMDDNSPTGNSIRKSLR
jgi:protein phosphatase